MITLYDSLRSGHSHRVRMLLAQLELPYQSIALTPEERRAQEHLARNPFGQIPVLVDGELTISDSTAILVYLARCYDEGRSWLPEDPVDAARVQRWLSVASGELFAGPVTARAIVQMGRAGDLSAARTSAKRLLEVLDTHLADSDWLACDHPTIADLAHYPYLRVCDEGGLDLAPYANVRAWLERVEGLERFVPMPRATR